VKLSIDHISTADAPDAPQWTPSDPLRVYTFVRVVVTERGRRAGSDFAVRVATPAGLAQLESAEGVLSAGRPLLLLPTHDFAALSSALRSVVSDCEAETMAECVRNLQRYFEWEYAGIEGESRASVRTIRLTVHEIATAIGANARHWQPEDTASVDELFRVTIGEKSRSESSSFTFRVATPKGLVGQRAIMLPRSLLLLEQYDFDVMFGWLQRTVKACEAETWRASVENLERFFDRA
jgi:hypothetical protein